MVFHRTILDIADNSGALKALCIKVLKSTSNHGFVGDRIVLCIKRYVPRKKVKKGEVRMGILVRHCHYIQRPSGTFYRFLENSVVLVDKKYSPISSRIFGPVSHELRKKHAMKIISMAPCSL